MERTFIVIKSDGVARGLMGKIIVELKEKDLDFLFSERAIN